jgi:hypothetical protein
MDRPEQITPSRASATNGPPLPRLALTIGVIGHRPLRLAQVDPALIESEVNYVLTMIAHEVGVVHRRYSAFFSSEAPELSLVSALAEGADRLVAKAALAKGFMLDVPIPFVKEVYEADFAADLTQESAALAGDGCGAASSLEEFNALTTSNAARSVLELPGKRRQPRCQEDPDADKAYEMAGITVIGQSDVLLTVWDGGPSGGPGGTAAMLPHAIRRGVPIIEINISGTNETRICWSSLRESPLSAEQITDLPTERFDEVLPRMVEEFLRPPSAAGEREAFLDYVDPLRISEGKGRGIKALAWPARKIGGSRLGARAAAHAESYAELMKSVSGDLRGVDRTWLATVFGWADVMAIGFARNFRRAIIVNFVAAAAAVIAALASLLTQGLWPVVCEIALIIGVMMNTLIGRRLGWHMRWMASREVAERIRVAILFWILGAQPRAFFGEDPTWPGWYVRAAVRAQGMRSGRLDREGMSGARAEIIKMVEHQHDYHRRNARRMKRREKLLEWAGAIFFGGTLLVALVHVSEANLSQPLFHFEHHHDILIILSAVLPALATATYLIRLLGDFEGIAKRSEQTEQNIRKVIEALYRDPANLALFRARAQVVADAMLGDVSSWRLAAESRDLAIPG